MLDLDRVWNRVAQLPQFVGKKIGDFGVQALPQNFTLTSLQAGAPATVSFPAGAVITSIAAAARPDGAAAQSYTNGLDLFSIIVQLQGSRYLVGPAAGIAGTIFGNGALSSFPGKEIVLPANASLLITVANLTTSTINVTVTPHFLVPLAIG